MQNLKANIDVHSGFCFGVVYAIEMAEDALNEKGYLYCLGDIVHNDEEVNRLKNKGLRIIDYNTFESLNNETVLIRAHGEPPSTYQTAIKNNITLIDATCPVVLKLQNRIKTSHDKNENILLFGQNGHAETIGLMGQINNTGQVFAQIDEINYETIPDKKITLYTQTTKSKEKFYEIADKLKSKGYEVNVHDTTCTQVSDRDNQLRKFASQYDKIVFVAGTKSSNGKVLYNVCKSVNTNSYFVSSEKELDPSWFNTNDNVGVCGATSTPLWLMQQVKEKIETF